MAKADRTGKMKRREVAKRKAPDLGYYIIVTDTNATEANYLKGLRDSLPKELQGRLVIKVVKSSTKDLVKSCKTQAALEPQYGEPWIVFDRDQVPHFDDIVNEAKKEGIGVGWSNPCIEIWFDAYFGSMHGYMDSKQCNSRFAETFEQKTGREYNKADQHIYGILNKFGDEAKAIRIAEKRMKAHADGGTISPSAMCPGTTLHRLVDEVRKKTDG